MGVAAYNRGSSLVSRQIDANLPNGTELLLRDLTDVSAKGAGATLFQDTIARRLGEEWIVVNNPDKGWASYGTSHKSLWEIAREYRVGFVGFGSDKFSAFIALRALPGRPNLSDVTPAK